MAIVSNVSTLLVDQVVDINGNVLLGTGAPVTPNTTPSNTNVGRPMSVYQSDNRLVKDNLLASGQVSQLSPFENLVVDNSYGAGYLFNTLGKDGKPLISTLGLGTDTLINDVNDNKSLFNINGDLFELNHIGSNSPNNVNDNTFPTTAGIPVYSQEYKDVEYNSASITNPTNAGDWTYVSESNTETLPNSALLNSDITWWSPITPVSTVTSIVNRELLVTLTGTAGTQGGVGIPVRTHRDMTTLLTFDFVVVNIAQLIVKVYHTTGYKQYTINTAGPQTLDISGLDVYQINFEVTSVVTGISTSLTIISPSVKQSGDCIYVSKVPTPAGYNMHNGSHAFDPVSSATCKGLVFVEKWSEEIALTDMVYPEGKVQYYGDDTDGLTGIVQGTFTGSDTYSLYGEWQPVSTIIGKGYVWSTLTTTEKETLAANPANYIITRNNKVYQTRFRVRYIHGFGNNWVNIKGHNVDTTYNAIYSESPVGNNFIQLQGANPAPVDFGPYNGNIAYGSPANNLQFGVYGNNNVTMLPIVALRRHNYGVYHPDFNRGGTSYFRNNNNDNRWYNSLINSEVDCFRVANITPRVTFVFDANGQRVSQPAPLYTVLINQAPDGQGGQYNAIHSTDVEDLRWSANRVEDVQSLLETEFRKKLQYNVNSTSGAYVFAQVCPEVTITATSYTTQLGATSFLKFTSIVLGVSADQRSIYSDYDDRGYLSGDDTLLCIGDNGESMGIAGIKNVGSPGLGTQLYLNAGVTAAEFNSKFPILTKLKFYGPKRDSYQATGVCISGKTVGHITNINSRTKYTIVAGTAQVVNLLQGDVIKDPSGVYWVSVINRLNIDISTDTLSNTVNWEYLGNVGSSGGYNVNNLSKGLLGIPVRDKKDSVVTLSAIRKVNGAYTFRMNDNVLQAAGFGLIAVLVTSGSTTISLRNFNSPGVITQPTKGYYYSGMFGDIEFNITGTTVYSAATEANTVVRFIYSTLTPLSYESGSNKVLAINDGWYGADRRYNYGAILTNKLVKKTPITPITSHPNSSAYRFRAPEYSLTSLGAIDYSRTGRNMTHPTFSHWYGDSVGVKILPLLTTKNGQLYLTLLYEEVVMDNATFNMDGTPSSTWGGGTTLSTATSPSVKNDINGNTIHYGTVNIPLPNRISRYDMSELTPKSYVNVGSGSPSLTNNISPYNVLSNNMIIV